MDMSAHRVIVTGKVQGVGYRNWAVSRARTFGVTGYVRNCGTAVEAIVSGDDDAVDRMIEAMRVGPAMARVDHLEVQAANDAKLKGFTKRLGA
jgi:acylphosphatase